ncbi:MAG: hypothetical protein Q4G23_01610 [Clostridia bacterium]|nr:hypothetical protein [Clostridia bacterium]
MDNEKLHACCFFGHRKINKTPELLEKLTETIEFLIADKGVITFYFGSKSEFDDLCYKVVSDLKEKYIYIKRIYVRVTYQHIDDAYKNYLLESYEDTYFPEQIENSGRASYVKRNREMIDNSDYCVIYYDKSYVPPKSKNNRQDLLCNKTKSGTAIAYDYAAKKGKKVINVI